MDRSIYRWVNRLAERSSWAHGFFKLYAGAGIALFALFLLAGYLDARHHGRAKQLAACVWAALAALLAVGVGQLIGHAVGRARPYNAMPGLLLLGHRTADFSFPSDHATAAGAVAVGLFLANRRWGIPALVAAVLMAFARVYTGVHYPSDVLVGLLLGGVVAALGYVLIVPSLGRLVERLERTRVRVVLTSVKAT